MNKNEIIEILSSTEKSIYNQLLEKSFNIKLKFTGKKIWIRGILEFSNYCIRNCLYCGLRKDNKNLKRYRMTPDEIFRSAKEIIKTGIKTIVLQSGDDIFYNREKICEIIKKIKDYDPEVAITLSIGERTFEDYLSFYKSGAERYLLKHETANETLYNKLHPGQSFKKRKEILLCLREIGYQIGAGNIIGLPDQSLNNLIEDLLFLKKLNPDMAGIGPFIPQKNTPLANYPPGNTELVIKFLALTRILTKNTHLPATTALITSAKNKIKILEKSFLAGADVVMLNFTPQKYRKNYKIYDNRKKIILNEIIKATKKLNLEISFDRGDSLKKYATFNS